MIPVFRNAGERSTAKSYRPVSLLSVVSKIFENLINNRIFDDLEKCDLFSDFQYCFRSSRSTADLLTVVPERIARAFTRYGTTKVVALDISKTFSRILYPGLGRVWHAGLGMLHKPKYYGISSQISGLISSFLDNKRLRLALDGNSSRISSSCRSSSGLHSWSYIFPTIH